MEETDKIMKAQMARGVDFPAVPLKERIKAIVPLLVPLFVSAFKRAEELATAMEATWISWWRRKNKISPIKLAMQLIH